MAISNMHKNLIKIARVVPEISSLPDRQADRQTDRQTHTYRQTHRRAHYNTSQQFPWAK